MSAPRLVCSAWEDSAREAVGLTLSELSPYLAVLLHQVQFVLTPVGDLNVRTGLQSLQLVVVPMRRSPAGDVGVEPVVGPLPLVGRAACLVEINFSSLNENANLQSLH